MNQKNVNDKIAILNSYHICGLEFSSKRDELKKGIKSIQIMVYTR